jgi:FkbM family methyltransferase
MFTFIKRKLRKRKLKNTFQEYGFQLKQFELEGLGKIEYAQWLHPFEEQKEISLAHVDFYRALSKPGGLIIDIGAHTGDTTVPMALAVGKEGTVLALEPNRFVYKVLQENANLNTSLTNIVPLPYAATEKAGTFTFNYSDASFCNGGFLSQIENSRHHHNYTLEVEGIELESYLFENYAAILEQLQLIKVDAEGYDKEILKTIPRLINTYRPAIMAECYKRLNQQEREELFDTITQHNYRLYYIEDFIDKGTRVELKREDMMEREHFEMLALPV